MEPHVTGTTDQRPTAPLVGRPFSRRAAMLGGLAAGVGLLTAGQGLLAPAAEAAALAPLYQRCSFGAYADNEPWPGVQSHYDLERELGARLGRMSWFMDMGSGWPQAQGVAAAASGHDIMVAWQPSAGGRPLPFSEILAGRWDQLLVPFFQQAAAFPGKVILRPFWEMNADAASYSLNRTGDRQVADMGEWIRTWRYLVTLQRRVGGSRIRWFFCANGSDVGPNPVEAYYPGVDWVHEIGFDTYNDHWEPWTNFSDKIAPMYRRLMRIDTRSPFTIGEIGCMTTGAPRGESKATWMNRLFLSTRFPRLTNVVFFHAKKEADWRLTSSPDVAAVSRQYLPSAPGGRR